MATTLILIAGLFLPSSHAELVLLHMPLTSSTSDTSIPILKIIGISLVVLQETLLFRSFAIRNRACSWLDSLASSGRCPGSLGTMVEKSCLSAISAFGLHLGDLHIPAKIKITSFDDIFSSLPPLTTNCLKFFVPNDSCYKDIDALYLTITNTPTKSALIVPIQITINREGHSDSEANFYLTYSRWVTHFEGYTVTTIFVWTVESEWS